MSLLGQWQSVKQQVKQEWQANKRLQLISGLSVVLFVVWSCVQLEQMRSSMESDARAAFVKLQDTRSAANEKRWPERAKKSEAEREAMRQWLWQARSEGEAQASLRDWLGRQARDSGLVIDRISVELGGAPQNMRVRPARAELQGVYLVGAWQQFMHKLGSATPRVMVESDEINFENPRKRKYRVSVTAWFELKATQGALL